MDKFRGKQYPPSSEKVGREKIHKNWSFFLSLSLIHPGPGVHVYVN